MRKIERESERECERESEREREREREMVTWDTDGMATGKLGFTIHVHFTSHSIDVTVGVRAPLFSLVSGSFRVAWCKWMPGR